VYRPAKSCRSNLASRDLFGPPLASWSPREGRRLPEINPDLIADQLVKLSDRSYMLVMASNGPPPKGDQIQVDRPALRACATRDRWWSGRDVKTSLLPLHFRARVDDQDVLQVSKEVLFELVKG